MKDSMTESERRFRRDAELLRRRDFGGSVLQRIGLLLLAGMIAGVGYTAWVIVTGF